MLGISPQDPSANLTPPRLRERQLEGTGYVPQASERVTVNGSVATASGRSVKQVLTARLLIEFFATFVFMLLGTLGSVNAAHNTVFVKTTGISQLGAYKLDNSSGLVTNETEYSTLHGSYVFLNNANGIISANQSNLDLSNPLSAIIVALVWSGSFILVRHLAPLATLNPWLVLNHQIFAWKSNGDIVSGTHVRHSLLEGLMAVIGEVVGGIAALMCVYWLQGHHISRLGETLPTDRIGGDWEIIFYEMTACFLFLSLLHMVSKPRRQISSRNQTYFMGCVYFVLMLSFQGYTGCSLNFVRTFAPALVRSMFGNVAMRVNVLYYFLGQFMGFTLAGLTAWIVGLKCGRAFDKAQLIEDDGEDSEEDKDD